MARIDRNVNPERIFSTSELAGSSLCPRRSTYYGRKIYDQPYVSDWDGCI